MIQEYGIFDLKHQDGEKHIDQLYSSTDETSRFPGMCMKYVTDKMRYCKIVMRNRSSTFVNLTPELS